MVVYLSGALMSVAARIGMVVAAAIVAAFLIPASASAAADHWSVGQWLGGGAAGANPNTRLLTGVYCHELDSVYTRNIEINANWPFGGLYGSWVSYQTGGLRTYAGAYVLRGACYNPHSVGYAFNAHDNY